MKTSAAGGPFRKAALFFLVTLAWSWGCWIPAAVGDQPVAFRPTAFLFALGGLGPPLGTLTLLWVAEQGPARRDYWRRLTSVGRIGPRGIAIIVLLPPALSAFGALAILFETGALPLTVASSRVVAAPLTLIPFALFTLVFGPLPEEIAWRGYAQDLLQSPATPLTASLIVGAVSALWHVPLFFIEGTYQHDLGVGTPGFFLFTGALLPQSVLLAWLDNQTGRSIPATVLFHFMTNFTGELLPLPVRGELYPTLATATAALGVVLVSSCTMLRARAAADASQAGP